MVCHPNILSGQHMATPIKQNLEAPLSEGQLRLSLETKLERRAEEGRWIYREKDVEDETARQEEKTTDNIHRCNEEGH